MPLPPGFAALVVFVSAAAVLVLEILALRLIAPYVGVTLQTNTAVIGAALTAIAIGAWTGGRAADRTDPGRLLGPLLLVAAALTLLTLPVVRFTGEATRGSGDASATLLLAMVAVVAPAALLSAVTPMVAKLQLHDLRQTGTVVGRLSGIGTAGAIVATFATGFVLVAAFPTGAILLGTGVVVAATGAAVLWLRWRAVRGPERGTVPLAVAALLPAAVLLVAVSPNPCQAETEYHCARVTADPDRRGRPHPGAGHPAAQLRRPRRPALPGVRVRPGDRRGGRRGPPAGRAGAGAAHRRWWLHRAPLPGRVPARAPPARCWRSTAAWSRSAGSGWASTGSRA